MFADRVKQTSTYPGGAVNYPLDGSVTGFQDFIDAIGAGNQCHYVAENGTDWEIGIGQVNAGTPPTLARVSVLASSNGGLTVSFAAGTLTLYVTPPARGLEITHVRHNLRGSSVPPTVTDDSNDGYGRCSMWVDESNSNIYMCADPWPGAAVWVLIAEGYPP